MSSSLAFLAFESIVNKLTETRPLKIAEINKFLGTKKGAYPVDAPLFVTWNKNGKLRGCIGTFSALPLEEGVSKYALISAFDDERFQPISVLEISQLSVGITILDNFVAINDPEDWTIGTHGLKVLFKLENRTHLGTFLPLVAEEQEWDHVETLWNLLQKAGYRGVPLEKTIEFYESALEIHSMRLVRYEGVKVGATYEEYADFRHKYTQAA